MREAKPTWKEWEALQQDVDDLARRVRALETKPDPLKPRRIPDWVQREIDREKPAMRCTGFGGDNDA